MNKHILIFIFTILTFGTSAIAQNLDKEVGFKYVKAEYLLSTERMEEAIKELNDIIKVSPFYKDALMLRAMTKYKLGAFKGAKDDIMQSIEATGITQDAATLLGKTEYSVGNMDAALNSLSASISMGVQDERVFEMRASIYEEKGQLLKACDDWNAAADLGSTKGAINAKKLCGRQSRPNKTNTKPAENDTTPIEVETNDNDKIQKPTNANTGNDTDGVQDSTDMDSPYDPSTEIEEFPEDNTSIPEEDNTPNNIEIDDDLSLTIFGQGIGKRKVLDRPSILILSDESGTVAVEICINENGKVDYAEFNPSKSTLTKNSLVSLAIRKSKEFWFEKSDYEKQCGFIFFNIKGSE